MLRRVVPLLVVLAAALLSSRHVWTGPVNWVDPDSLFYQAQSLEVRGEERDRALRRVFDSSLAGAARSWDHDHRYASNSGWVTYSSRFYRRRWLVPALAAAFAPAFGDRSLQLVSLLAYVGIGLLLYALLSRRFSATVSAAAAVACLWLPPLRWYAFEPLTDSAGVALMLAAMVAALIVLERGGRWLPLWLVTMAALSLTKEDSLVVVVAVAWLAIRVRSRLTVTLAATSIALAAPVLLLLGAPLRETLAYTEANFQEPSDASWGYVFRHYPHALRSMVHDDLLLPRLSGWAAPVTALWYVGCVFVVAAIAAVMVKRTRDPLFRLLRGALLGAIVFMLLAVNYSALRLELVFVPAVGVGLALLFDALLARDRRRSFHWPSFALGQPRSP